MNAVQKAERLSRGIEQFHSAREQLSNHTASAIDDTGHVVNGVLSIVRGTVVTLAMTFLAIGICLLWLDSKSDSCNFGVRKETNNEGETERSNRQ